MYPSVINLSMQLLATSLLLLLLCQHNFSLTYLSQFLYDHISSSTIPKLKIGNSFIGIFLHWHGSPLQFIIKAVNCPCITNANTHLHHYVRVNVNVPRRNDPNNMIYLTRNSCFVVPLLFTTIFLLYDLYQIVNRQNKYLYGCIVASCVCP